MWAWGIVSSSSLIKLGGVLIMITDASARDSQETDREQPSGLEDVHTLDMHVAA
jgi:hypothetical protein